nr:MAG TPA: hypothetical protein [Bacteriophage sp.]
MYRLWLYIFANLIWNIICTIFISSTICFNYLLSLFTQTLQILFYFVICENS